MLAMVLEEEVNSFLGRHRYARNRQFRGYRNGYHQTRELTVGLAAVEVRVPRAIGIPMIDLMGANLYITVGAILSGGIFGDHCSPISDTTIISSMASASDHIDHVRTQLPYALTAAGGALLIYLIIGLF